MSSLANMKLSCEDRDQLRGTMGGGEGVEQLQAHWSGLLDREPGQANHRLIQRRRVYVYTSASVFVHVEVCLH